MDITYDPDNKMGCIIDLVPGLSIIIENKTLEEFNQLTEEIIDTWEE